MNNSDFSQMTCTMDEAMVALKISRKTIYELINSQKLRTYKIGSRRYCTHQAIIECQKLLEEESAA